MGLSTLYGCTIHTHYTQEGVFNPLILFSEKKLFTPGPLGVSPAVRAAMNVDVGSRDAEFINAIKTIRRNLVEIAGNSSLLL
jgi:hypothetical protein